MSTEPPVLGPMQPVPWPPPTGKPEGTPTEQPARAVPPREQPTEAPPPPPLTPEEKRARAAARRARALRDAARVLRAAARRWAMVVIGISAVITAFGAGNAHQVFVRHDTTDPWAWLPYPALEAALIVEIQIGAVLAEHGRRVTFWGAALRTVTAVAAVTICVYGPAETGDPGGAALHAIGPVVQFFLAEFLARSRAEFRAAVQDLLDDADGKERAAERRTETGPATARKRSPKTHTAAGRTGRRTGTGPGDGDRSRDQETGPELVLTPPEKKVLSELQAKGQRISKRTIINAVRAGGGAIGSKRALAIARVWGPASGGPELHVVEKKEA